METSFINRVGLSVADEFVLTCTQGVISVTNQVALLRTRQRNYQYNTMSSSKQAGISLNRALAIAAQATRNALKAEFRVAAEKRSVTEAKVVKYENGTASEAKPLGN